MTYTVATEFLDDFAWGCRMSWLVEHYGDIRSIGGRVYVMSEFIYFSHVEDYSLYLLTWS